MRFAKVVVFLAVFTMSGAFALADNNATANPQADSTKKMTAIQAKTECLKENTKLKGKLLNQCISAKRKLASKKS